MIISAVLFFNAPEDLQEYLHKNLYSEYRNNTIMCIGILGISCVCIPILCVTIWAMPYKSLKRGFCRKRFGVLYEEIKFKK